MGCTLLEAPSMPSRVGWTRFLPEEEGAGGAEALSRVTGVDDAGCEGERGVAAEAVGCRGGRGELAGAKVETAGAGAEEAAAGEAAEDTRPNDSATDAGTLLEATEQGATNRVGAMRFFLGGSAAAGPSRTVLSSKEGGSNTFSTSAGAATTETHSADRATASVTEVSEVSIAARGVAAVASAGTL